MPRRQNFALEIPTCWYTPNLKFALPPTPTPHASQWNISGIGPSSIGLALGMYISYFLCRFYLLLVVNANPVSSGIWAIVFIYIRNNCIDLLIWELTQHITHFSEYQQHQSVVTWSKYTQTIRLQVVLNV